MHEMSLCENILQILEDHSIQQGFERVKIVFLEIGLLSAVEPEAMLFCFDAVIQGTLAEHAKLEIIEVPGNAWCTVCSKTVPLHQRFDACPECGAYPLQITGGADMKIRKLEVE